MLYFFSVPIFNQSSLNQHPEHQESTHFSLPPTPNRNLHVPTNRSHVGLHLLAYFLYLPAVHSLPSRLYTESPHSPLLVSLHTRAKTQTSHSDSKLPPHYHPPGSKYASGCIRPMPQHILPWELFLSSLQRKLFPFISVSGSFLPFSSYLQFTLSKSASLTPDEVVTSYLPYFNSLQGTDHY